MATLDWHLSYARNFLRTRNDAMRAARRYRDGMVKPSKEIICDWVKFARMENRFAVHQLKKARACQLTIELPSQSR